MAATLQWIQSELGPVTALVHTARAASPRQVADLTEPEFRANATATPAARYTTCFGRCCICCIDRSYATGSGS